MILVIAVIVFAVGIWRNAASLPEMFLTAVSLAVARAGVGAAVVHVVVDGVVVVPVRPRRRVDS